MTDHHESSDINSAVAAVIDAREDLGIPTVEVLSIICRRFGANVMPSDSRDYQGTPRLPLLQVDTLPESINLEELSLAAIHAAFNVIGKALDEATGCATYGDFFPNESALIEETFEQFVRALAVNNPAIVRMQSEEWKRGF